MSLFRVKFNVSEITKYGNAGGGKVVLVPTTGAFDEKDGFRPLLPDGRIEVWTNNAEEMSAFDFCTYYVDFSKAE